MSLLKRAFAALVLLSAGTAASAEPLSFSGLDETKWRNEIVLYGFLPARTTGTSTIAGTPVTLDLDLGEAIELLRFAASGRYEGWKGDWGIIADVNYVSMGDSGTLPGGRVTLTADIEQFWFGALVAYRAVNTTFGPDNKRFALDVQGGLRYNSITQRISASPSPAPFPLGGTESWVEPVIGARGMWQFNDRWAAVLEGDIGGFGAGGNDFVYGVNALVDWKPWKNTSIRFGYRVYGINLSTTRSDGPFGYNITQHGPYIGAVFRWQ